MRILHTENSCGWGGQEIRILSEAAGLIERGHDVRLVCPAESRIFAEAPRFGVPAAALPIARRNLRGLFALRRWLIEHPTDVINSHSSTDSWLAALACATLCRPPPIVRTRHISAPLTDNAPTRWLYATASQRIVTTGEMLKNGLVATLGCDPARVVSIPTGIDTTRFIPVDAAGRGAARRHLNLPDATLLVGIVATLRSWKGHADLIAAFAAAALPDARLVIVGDGPQRENLQTQIAAAGLGDRVLLAGQQTDVLPWLQALDIFALPSYANEGVPQALLQAMLVGLPCITTTIGAIPEIALAQRTAVVVPPRDVAALAQALGQLAADPERRAALGQAARAHVAQGFSRTRMLDRMETVFREAFATR
jgi:glycosyltransferase involved in cell wall biosynthesis